VLPIFLQMARGFSTMEAGLILFCRPLGGFLASVRARPGRLSSLSVP
jgi:hypothetical protein